MAIESTERTFSQFEFHNGMSSVLGSERPTHLDYDGDDDDDPSVIRSNNIVETDYTALMEQAYPGILTQLPVQAEAALDIRRGGDLNTVAKVSSDKKAIQQVAVSFMDKLHHVDTGAIDLPGVSREVKLGIVASVLVEQAIELSKTATSDEENAALKAQNEQLLSMVTPDQLIMMRELQEKSNRIAELEAQLKQKDATIVHEREKVADRDRVIYGQSLDTFRGRMTKLKGFGGAVMHLSRTA